MALQLRREQWNHTLSHHRFHFARHTGQRDQRGALPRQPEPGGGTDWIRQHGRAGRNQRLSQLPLVRRPAPWAIASLVQSSTVGPSPPVMTITLARPTAVFSTWTISVRSSPTTDLK